MDFEEVVNITNVTLAEHIPQSPLYQIVLRDIVLTVVITAGILCDSLITYTIFKFRKLRTVSNIFVANWALADMLHLTVTPSGYKIVSILDGFRMSTTLVCILWETGMVMHLIVHFFVIVVALDWMMIGYFRKERHILKNYHRHVLSFIWILGFAQLCFYLSHSCFMENLYMGYSILPLMWTHFLCFVIVATLWIWKCVRHCLGIPVDTDSPMLALATGFIICRSLLAIYYIFISRIIYHPLIESLGECVMFSSATVNLILLYVKNQDFQACLNQVFRRTENPYQESFISFDNEIVTTETNTSTTVTLDVLENDKQKHSV